MGVGEDVVACIRIIKDHPYHWYEDMTIVMVLAGKIKLRVWARDNIMITGDILVLNRGEIHKLTAITKDNLIAVISINREFCLGACEDFEESVILCNSVQYGANNKEKYHKLKLKLSDLIYEYGKSIESEEAIHLTKEFVTYLCDHFDYLSVGEGDKQFSQFIINRNKMLYRSLVLESTSLSDMSLKKLSEHLGLNYTHFRTDIIQRFGVGYSYLKYKVMTERAGRMILTTNHRLIDISNQCGFSDQKYLRKYIKKFYECTPSDFRNEYKNRSCKDAYVEIPLNYMTKVNQTLKKK